MSGTQIPRSQFNVHAEHSDSPACTSCSRLASGRDAAKLASALKGKVAQRCGTPPASLIRRDPEKSAGTRPWGLSPPSEVTAGSLSGPRVLATLTQSFLGNSGRKSKLVHFGLFVILKGRGGRREKCSLISFPSLRGLWNLL